MPGLYNAAASPEQQRERFRSGEVPVAVYGLGKMGLPLASVYAENTGAVTGVDIDETVVERVNAGDSPVQGEPGLDELVASLAEDGSLTATTDGVAAARDARIHVVVVPTLIDDEKRPDLSAVESVIHDIAAGLRPGDLVIMESTLPPRATTDVIRPLLEAESGLNAGSFGLAVCPERTSSGRALADIRGTHPKVVGGFDEESGRAATLIYEELVDNDIVTVPDATTAEAVKVFEGLYRDVNIALANDLARLTDELDIDVRAAIHAANTQPYSNIHTPGPGVGGHCIPYYPYFVLNWLEGDTPTLSTSRAVNDSMPGFVVDRVAEGLAAASAAVPGSESSPRIAAEGTIVDAAYAPTPEPAVAERQETPPSIAAEGTIVDTEKPTEQTAGVVSPADALDGATVAVLGLTYRAGVKETRASPGIAIVETLADRGATVLAADPLVDAAGLSATDVSIADLPTQAPDAVVLATAHDAFDTVDWAAMPPTIVVDGHDALDLAGTEHQQYIVGRGWR